MTSIGNERLGAGDYADMSSAETDFHLQVALANQRAKSQQVLPYTGLCHFCHDKVEGEARFCDEDCRKDYEKQQRRQGFRV